ncbi:hypothetical protein NRB56_40500 [Nocardia sp. RB56]|uniref:LGFP repeat-containing protein n=1 Tax=Nocardia aurantia TaxID=2585199 RepID=A0A7K0DRX0_9NOCA|nr:hypothetical protein [Nocardia aurantia]
MHRHRVAVVAGLVSAVLVAGTAATASARQIGGFDVGGAIETEYDQSGGFDLLGNPTGPDSLGANGGHFQVFEHGSIYWSPDTGAHEIGGFIRDRWGALGWEKGVLGYPTTRESDATDGKYNNFQNGSIYWSQDTGAHQIGGAIYVKWAAHDYERGPLGFPTSDEFATKGGGKANLFSGGAIYWTKATTAHILSNGPILDQWTVAGSDSGRYGFPTSDEYDVPGGKAQNFQHGTITVRS